MCNYLKFWLCARQTARVEQCLTVCSPILRSFVLDYVSPSSLVSLVLSVIAIFFTSQTYMSHPFPLCSVLLRSVRWHLLSTSPYSELCKTNPHLRQLHLLAAHWAQSARVGMSLQASAEEGFITFLMTVNSREGFKKNPVKIIEEFKNQILKQRHV